MKSSVSVSPPRSSTLPIPAPPLLASKSADGSATSNHSIPHVHTRSHSFTPKLSSKLAAPRFGPPSPVRKGSGASEREFPVKELDKSTINASQADASPPVRNTTLLAPPLIIEPDVDAPEADVVTDTKRSSQIVYHSGFINRLTETNANFFRHPPDLSSDRGWKPFKLELKGSKLYFYKPPGDRAPGIKALFPTQVDEVWW
ncbi:hypothetical protein ONZ45_g9930 [Pleurotus djamor]|nr:hypothetical protein ONZ45_g9930 [Pleurotus djamor]